MEKKKRVGIENGRRKKKGHVIMTMEMATFLLTVKDDKSIHDDVAICQEKKKKG
jgi:hypothetical protein